MNSQAAPVALDKTPFLLVLDVDAVQSFLFSSIRLSTIAGASTLVVQHDAWVKREAMQRGAEVLASTGGTAALLFATREAAEAFAAYAARTFRQRTFTGHLTASEPIDVRAFSGATSFGDAMTAAWESVEQRKRLGFAREERAVPPLARRCETCGQEPAQHEIEIGEDSAWVGDACRAKREARRRGGDWFDRLKQEPNWESLNESHLPADFNELGGARDEHGALALVVADVNRVGQRLKKIRSADEYRAFAAGLQDAAERTMLAGLKQAEPWKGEKLPIVVLYHGGDDLVFACRGDLALPLLDTLTTTFAQLAGPTAAWTNGTPLGLSASAVITGRGFPFRTGHRIASRLLSETKRAWPEGGVDFALITEAHADAERLLEDRFVGRGPSKLHLTARPFCVGDAVVPRSFSGFRAACEKLSDEFPRSRLFDLRTLCTRVHFRDEVEQGRVVSECWRRLKDELAEWHARTCRREETRKVWADVLRLTGHAANGFLSNEEWRTGWGDLADGVDMWGAT